MRRERESEKANLKSKIQRKRDRYRKREKKREGERGRDGEREKHSGKGENTQAGLIRRPIPTLHPVYVPVV